ncbi:MAG: hypothetical protein HQK91_14935 [Nitrospirae bacterium]|nr:hypothetical protein [Nitrospirota bacterium]
MKRHLLRYNTFNFILVIIILALGIWFHLNNNEDNTKLSISVKNSSVSVKDEGKGEEINSGIINLAKDAEIIVKRNLFDSGRSVTLESQKHPLPILNKPEVKAPPPMPPAPELKGITILSDDAFAYLADSVTKTEKAYRVNEKISDFLITKIEPKKITLLYGKTEVTLNLRFE